MDFRKKVYEIIGSICGLEVDSQDKSLSDDLGIDSLGMVALLIELEDSLNIELEESDMNPLMLKTTEDIVKLAEKYI
jgi:acyl carrier protein 1